MAPLNELVEKVLMSILKTGIMKYGNQVCVLIGNLGSTTEMECLIVAKEVQEQLGKCPDMIFKVSILYCYLYGNEL